MIHENEQIPQTLILNREGVELVCAGKIEEAIGLFQRGIEADPQFPNNHLDLGAALKLSGKMREAVSAFRTARSLKPSWGLALYNLGTALLDAGEVEESITTLRETLTIEPGWVLAHNGLGMALLQRQALDEAKASFQRALDLDPECHLPIHSLCTLQWHQKETGAAISTLRHGLRSSAPACDYCHLALSMALLSCGDYAEGWEEYEWRWRCEGAAPKWDGLDQPLWDGSPLEGKTIAVWAEQGLGDILQFVRFASLLEERGGTVWVLSRPNLDTLLATCPGVARVVSDPGELKGADVQVPMASLPRLLGITLDGLSSIPVPYLTPPDRRTLDPFGPRRGGELRVGIVWGVEPGQPNWQNRSCPLPLFQALETIPGVELYSLQFGSRSADLRQPGAPRAADLSAVLGDFANTAAVVEHLDLVITVDTSMAHLAGAVGQKVWPLIPYDSDWRWLRDREDSPWYPTMRLFRQQEFGRWEPVMERVSAALRELMP